MNGLIIAAPTSNSGKTIITLALLRALRQQGIKIRSAKSGPDYIDPKFHSAATAKPCYNLDAWGMDKQLIRNLAKGEFPLLIEGAMGLFDGAHPNAKGATADLARMLRLAVILVIDVSYQAQSITALVNGFANHCKYTRICGLILNKVASHRHENILRTALANIPIPILGAVPRYAELHLPKRHLGLCQAEEHPELEIFLNKAAKIINNHIDIEQFMILFQPLAPPENISTPLAPPAQNIAIASDIAFSFIYPHWLDAWHRAGATLQFFSPLANEAPPACDIVFLPGGYPELHAERLANNHHFCQGMAHTKHVYGECGGYMVMGEALIDKNGKHHKMLGLLPLVTSFHHKKRTIGYRMLWRCSGFNAGFWPKNWGNILTAHEFHYATTVKANVNILFKAQDASGTSLAPMGLCTQDHCGSFAHIIGQASEIREPAQGE